MANYYTGIGSRVTPESITDTMSDLAVILYGKGYILRSGRAEGADYAFQRGAEHCFKSSSVSSNTKTKQEIYVPHPNFNTCFGNIGVIDVRSFENYAEAESIMEDIHPRGKYLKGFTREAHTRNVYQVLGRDLNTPSKFLICYASVKSLKEDTVKGGTATAYALAKLMGIPRFNLINNTALTEFMEFLNE